MAVLPAHTVCGDGFDAMPGAAVAVTDRLELVPVQPLALAGVTETLPLVEPQVTVIEVPPWPLVIVASNGTLHVYVVAPLTLLIEYVSPEAPAHTTVDPLTLPAAPTPVTVTAKLLEAPLPPPSDGVTVTVPDVAEHPKLTVIEVVPWPLAMVAPDGTVQV